MLMPSPLGQSSCSSSGLFDLNLLLFLVLSATGQPTKPFTIFSVNPHGYFSFPTKWLAGTLYGKYCWS